MKLKLYDYNHNKTVWQCADKLHVRDYAKKSGLKEHDLPKILGVYSNARDIDFDILPDKFVLKCTHGAGFNILCTNKAELDQEVTVNKLNKWLDTRFGLTTAETHYNKVKPSIICEEFIENKKNSPPNDYKVYCFDGVPRYVMACTERGSEGAKVNLMDLSWRDTHYVKTKFASDKNIAQPESLQEMLSMSSKVSKGFPFVRVDFYELEKRPILGEMTFTPHACINTNMTQEAQLNLGKLINTSYLNKRSETI